MVVLLVNPDNKWGAEYQIRTAQEAARAKGVQLAVLTANGEREIEAAFAPLHADALFVSEDAMFFGWRAQVAALAARYAVPAMYQAPQFVAAGGLISYSPDVDVPNCQVGIYAGRILTGEKPTDLPVQQPTVFKLVINPRPPRRSASPFRRRSAPASTRSSNSG